MKVGILTFHHTTNFGATLQTYALWYYISSLGIDVEIIDYRPKKAIKAYRKHLFGIGKPMVKNALMLAKMKFFVNNNLKLSSKKVFDKKFLKQYSGDYDIVICGSDEIWNINSFRGFDSAFFLDFVDSTKTQKSSYACSFGTTENLGKEYKAITKLLQEFSHLSVRDSNSKKIVDKIYTGTTCKVLDPTFLIQNHYSDLIQPIKFNKKYILIYGHVKQNESKIIYYLAEKLNLDIISIGSRVEIANKKILDANPVEWLTLFKNADFIFTEFYHGTIFSIIFQKQFWALHRKAKYIKVTDLLKDLGLERRILDINNLDNQEIKNELNILLNPIDYLFLFQNLNKRLEQSTQFISTILQ